MRVFSLASGSKGNATVIFHGGAALLIDCGINAKTFEARWRLLPEDLRACAPCACLITHSHTDHTTGLKGLLKHHPDLVLYANAMTAEVVAPDCGLSDDAFCCFENGQSFEVGPFTIAAFSIPHDTSDPVGYLVKADETYFHGTDIGTPLDSIGVKLAEADLATLESNHDLVLLRASGRPSSLIQRISGPRGHLSNDQSAFLVRRFAAPRLKKLALAHLSHDCNAPHLAEGTMRETLGAMQRRDVTLKVFSQDAVVEL